MLTAQNEIELKQKQKKQKLTANIYSTIHELRGQGIYDIMVITDIINSKLKLELSYQQVESKLQSYKENFMFNFLNNYKDNVFNAVEKYVFIYQKTMQEENYKVALQALSEIIKIQQLESFDIYEKFGIDTNEIKIDLTDKIRKEQLSKLIGKNKKESKNIEDYL